MDLCLDLDLDLGLVLDLDTAVGMGLGRALKPGLGTPVYWSGLVICHNNRTWVFGASELGFGVNSDSV